MLSRVTAGSRPACVSAAGTEQLLPAALLEDHHGNSPKHDLDVLPQRLPCKVLEVVTNLRANIVEAGIVIVVDLGQSGDARFGALPERILRNVLPQIHKNSGPLR